MDSGRVKQPASGGVTRRDGLKGAAAVAGAAVLAGAGAQAGEPALDDLLEGLAIAVPREANRQVIFTNKVSAVWLTQTHANDHPEHAWFAGLNVAKKKVMGDYAVLVGGSALDRTQASVTVWPDRIERQYPGGITETLRFAEGRVLVEITLAGAPADASIRLSGDGVTLTGTSDGVSFYQPGDGAPGVLGLARQGERFLIALEADEAAVRAALADGFATVEARHAAQRARMTNLISGDHLFECSDRDIEKAVRWMTLTMDRLVMDQGDKPGIYAGLPWFNEYWGRDSFIGLPGALLVTGQFETARKILVSFAQYMDMDETSRFYGRVPNIVQPDNLDYHSADGTPRWVLAVQAYVDWSGDTSIVEELWPQLVASVEGALKNWVDDDGFLTHADNETWMDARRQPDLKPYSPRGNRANDVQALWVAQLEALNGFGIHGDEPEFAGRIPGIERRYAIRDRVIEGLLGEQGPGAPLPRQIGEWVQKSIADRLAPDGTADHAVRPNALFVKYRGHLHNAHARVIEECVYPWGVASLSNRHSCFHPYHVAPTVDGAPLWHKDEAYHNGAVWQWLNGVAIEALVGLQRVDLAWTLFSNACQDVLARGCVGGMAENANAYPLPGETAPRLTGTCLQAWSNAEHLRVLSTVFAGIAPWPPSINTDEPPLVSASVNVPPELEAMSKGWRIGSAALRWTFRRDGAVQHHSWTVTRGTLEVWPRAGLEFILFDAQRLSVGQELHIKIQGNRAFLTFNGPGMEEYLPRTVWRETPRTSDRGDLESAFAGLDFAKPRPLSEHHAMTGQCRSGIGP